MTNDDDLVSNYRDELRSGLAIRATERFAQSKESPTIVDGIIREVYPDVFGGVFDDVERVNVLNRLIRIEALRYASDDALFHVVREAHDAGIPITKIATITGMSRSTVNLWIHGNRRSNPTKKD